METAPATARVASKINRLISAESGHTSLSMNLFVVWMGVYGYTGFLAGNSIGHPILGTLLGLFVGFYTPTMCTI